MKELQIVAECGIVQVITISLYLIAAGVNNEKPSLFIIFTILALPALWMISRMFQDKSNQD